MIQSQRQITALSKEIYCPTLRNNSEFVTEKANDTKTNKQAVFA